MATPERQQTKDYADKPIWGFGPAGWILTAVLAWMVVGSIRAGSVQFFFLSAAHSTLGDGAVYWFVIRWMPWAWFQLREAGFGTISLMIVLVCCHFSPRRVAWWKYALLSAWSVLQPALWEPLYRGGGLAAVAALEFLGTCGVLWLIMQRWKPLALAALGMGGALAVQLHLNVSGAARFANDVLWVTLIPYHASIAGALLWWGAIELARWRVLLSGTMCRACGYDLAGLRSGPEGTVCPECGRVVVS